MHHVLPGIVTKWSRNGHGISIVILDPYMMHDFKTNELLYESIFYIIKHECVCLLLSVFRSHQKSQGHEILALALIWASLNHYEARFSKF